MFMSGMFTDFFRTFSRVNRLNFSVLAHLNIPSSSSLPVLVNISPATTPTRRLVPPTILNKPQANNISSLHNIATTFFNELIYRWGRTTVISVTQCVLDLALIVSVHASLPSLCVAPNFSVEEYKKKYQQIIDPLKCTSNETEIVLSSKTAIVSQMSSTNTQSMIRSKSPDILTFYNSIKSNQANIRYAKCMIVDHLICFIGKNIFFLFSDEEFDHKLISTVDSIVIPDSNINSTETHIIDYSFSFSNRTGD